MTECWIWTRKRESNGYGQLQRNGKMIQAHKFIYEMFRGKVPDGLELDHLCRNRACVNPDHLEVVTHHENIMRGVGVGMYNARKTHCLHGHLYDEENTYVNRNRRHCRKCMNIRSRNRKRRVT